MKYKNLILDLFKNVNILRFKKQNSVHFKNVAVYSFKLNADLFYMKKKTRKEKYKFTYYLAHNFITRNFIRKQNISIYLEIFSLYLHEYT
jgi:hypothetical protein